MKLLLTGANGFMGSHLLRRLLSDGHKVTALKRSNSSLERVRDIAHEVAWYDLDIVDMAIPFQRQGGFDALIHTSTCYGRSGESLSTVMEANVGFPLQLLEKAAYFKTDTFFNTDTALSPFQNNYSLSKTHFAEWGRIATVSTAIRFVNIKLEHIYGPGDSSSKFTTNIIRQCLRDVPEIALTAGEQKRDFIHVDDVVEAYGLLVKKKDLLPKRFSQFGLGSGYSTRIRDFVELVHRLCGSSSRLGFEVLPYREHEIMESHADIAMLESFGWEPKLSLAEGIRRTILFEREST